MSRLFHRAFHVSRHFHIPIPYVIENTGRSIQSYDIFSRLLKERIICLNGPISDDLSSVITAQLLFLESEDPERAIRMYINSPGGSITAGLSIYDTMQYISSPVETTVTGQASSMGSLLSCSGNPGSRGILEHATIMIHQPSSGFSGQASDIAIHAAQVQKTREVVTDIYLRHINEAGKRRSRGEVYDALERDMFMDPKEAIEFGLVDKVYTKRER